MYSPPLGSWTCQRACNALERLRVLVTAMQSMQILMFLPDVCFKGAYELSFFRQVISTLIERNADLEAFCFEGAAIKTCRDLVTIALLLFYFH